MRDGTAIAEAFFGLESFRFRFRFRVHPLGGCSAAEARQTEPSIDVDHRISLGSVLRCRTVYWKNSPAFITLKIVLPRLARRRKMGSRRDQNEDVAHPAIVSKPHNTPEFRTIFLSPPTTRFQMCGLLSHIALNVTLIPSSPSCPPP